MSFLLMMAAVNTAYAELVIQTVAGLQIDKGPGTLARLASPLGIAVDNRGNIYIADTGNHRIRKMTPKGVISTIAGNGSPGFSGDNGPAFLASLRRPSGIAVDGAGTLYISDTDNHRVRKVTPQGIIFDHCRQRFGWET